MGFSLLQVNTTTVDSSSYNIGYVIGENIPVALLLIVAIFFIIRAYRRKDENEEKTDYLDDGTI